MKNAHFIRKFQMQKPVSAFKNDHFYQACVFLFSSVTLMAVKQIKAEWLISGEQMQVNSRAPCVPSASSAAAAGWSTWARAGWRRDAPWARTGAPPRRARGSRAPSSCGAAEPRSETSSQPSFWTWGEKLSTSHCPALEAPIRSWAEVTRAPASNTRYKLSKVSL